MTTEHVKVGKVKDAHGIRGELFIVLFAGEAAWLKQLQEVRLVNEGAPAEEGKNPKTLKLKSARVHKNGLIVKSADIPDRNYAETLKGWLLEIPSHFLISNKGESIYLREVQGFRVFTKDKGEVGVIQGFSHNNAQDLLLVKTGWGDFEIPFVEAFVESIDYDSKEMHLDLPEGLLGEDVDDASKESDASSGGADGSGDDSTDGTDDDTDDETDDSSDESEEA